PRDLPKRHFPAGPAGWGAPSRQGAVTTFSCAPAAPGPEPAHCPWILAHQVFLEWALAPCVPFPTPLEGEIAHGWSLALDAEPHQRVVGKDLPVSGRILAVPGIAEDCHLLRISVINFLDQLFLVVRTVWSFGRPPFPTKRGLGKWGEV
uniref:L antigen family member 3 n=1 Tax=Theropithecus gelada TaxID=9565 RepID=A0A8D2ELE9_THEGE